MGRSQAASIFWGLVSVFFAAAACYYFWKYHENETSTNVLRDTALTLQDQLETLKSQKDQLQSNISETEAQLKTREDFLSDKEAKLGLEESRLEGLAAQSDSKSEQSRSQAALVKKFNDTVRKLANGNDIDVVVRGGRPVLRVPSSLFFDFGAATLRLEGKTMLKQISQTLDGQLGNFELRVDAFTDSEGEADTSDAAGQTPPPEASNATPTPAAPHLNPGWDLTGRRAAALAHYFRDQTTLPFQNVIVVPRADSQPIIPSANQSNARNRRIEITITPAPVAFHPIDLNANDASVKSASKSDTGQSAKAGGQSAAKTAGHPKATAKPSAKSPDDSSSGDDTETPKPKKDAPQSTKGQP